MGMAYKLATQETVRDVAHALAVEIAKSAPLAVRSIRKTLRWGIADEIRKATDHELVEQTRLRESNDFREGTKAVSERRDGNFTMS